MIGVVKYYDDNTDAFEILGEDGKNYYGFNYNVPFQIGDTLKFDYYVIWPGKNETYIMKNIEIISNAKTLTIKKS